MRTRRAWTGRQWAAALAGTAASLLALGVPAVLIPNGLFTREIEPTWWSYPVWVAAAVLGGLLAATYAAPADARTAERAASRTGLGGGLLAWLAISCPLCNTLVLAAVGVSGALTWFAPLQPLLAAVALVLLIAALRARLRDPAPCTDPASC